MLDPDYLFRISEGAEQIASELHASIMNRVVSRIVARLGRGEEYILTSVDKWQIESLREAGILLDDIQAEIAKRTKLQTAEVKEAFEEAGVKNMAYDDEIYRSAGLSPEALEQSPELVRILQRGYEATIGEWINFTGSTALAAQQLFVRECDKAYNLVLAGSVSYSEAVREAVNNAAAEGITVTYPSGHTDTIETATARAVRTGISQACGDITDIRMEEMDWDIVIVSSHFGARVTERNDFTNHYWWQGKFYSKSGRDKRFEPFSLCGMGNVQGIHGANCRHSHGPGDGKHNPYEKFDSEENRKAYELRQKQRELERRIRKTKRQVMNLKTAMDGASDGVKESIRPDYERKARLLQKQNQEYNTFCEEHGLKKQQERLNIAKWDRKQAAAAREAAKKNREK